MTSLGLRFPGCASDQQERDAVSRKMRAALAAMVASLVSLDEVGVKMPANYLDQAIELLREEIRTYEGGRPA